MLRVLALTRYASLGASSRVRFHQFEAPLAEAGVEVTWSPLLDDGYLRQRYAGSGVIASSARAYGRRILALARTGRFDLLWLEKELLPWAPAWLERAALPRQVPLVVDYDDATFHQYNTHRSAVVRNLLGRKIDAVMRRANLVVAGNDYLARYAREAGASRVEMLPTVVDLRRYQVGGTRVPGPVRIGWIGSPTTVPYLRACEPALREVAASRGARLVAIGAYPQQLPDGIFEVRPWSEATEVSDIQSLDVGVMPLADEPWQRGKCGYKLIQYMACGKPVVASPVGANAVIVTDGVVGFHARSTADWVRSLEALCDDEHLRRRMGVAGRARVEEGYSLQSAAPRLAALLQSVVRPGAGTATP